MQITDHYNGSQISSLIIGIYRCSIYRWSVWYCFHGDVSKYAAGLRHYIGTNLRVDKCVIAINIGLITLTDIYICFWKKNIKYVPVRYTRGRVSLARENETGSSWGQEVHILHVNV